MNIINLPSRRMFLTGICAAATVALISKTSINSLVKSTPALLGTKWPMLTPKQAELANVRLKQLQAHFERNRNNVMTSWGPLRTAKRPF